MVHSVKRSFVSALLMLVCLGLIGGLSGRASSNVSRNSSNSAAHLDWLPASGNAGAIANSSSGLIRNADGVVLTVSTTGLLPNGAYTVWWVIFNDPQFCSPPGCDPGDFPQNGGNPNVGASVLWATGRVADEYGQADFSANLAAGGVSAAPGPVLFRPGLLTPNAEVLVVVRSHGPALTGADLNAQLTTFNGGCPPNTCEDVQAARHLP